MIILAGASGSSSQPWEGPPVILDGRTSSYKPAGSSTGTSSAGGLILPSIGEPIDDLMSSLQTGAVGSISSSNVMSLSGSAAQAAGADAASQQDVASLQQMVQQLQQQLQETRQVAQQWQSLHGELHQFCTDSVLEAAKTG